MAFPPVYSNRRSSSPLTISSFIVSCSASHLLPCGVLVFPRGTTPTVTSVLAQATYNPSSTSYPTTSTSPDTHLLPLTHLLLIRRLRIQRTLRHRRRRQRSTRNRNSAPHSSTFHMTLANASGPAYCTPYTSLGSAVTPSYSSMSTAHTPYSGGAAQYSSGASGGSAPYTTGGVNRSSSGYTNGAGSSSTSSPLERFGAMSLGAGTAAGAAGEGGICVSFNGRLRSGNLYFYTLASSPVSSASTSSRSGSTTSESCSASEESTSEESEGEEGEGEEEGYDALVYTERTTEFTARHAADFATRRCRLCAAPRAPTHGVPLLARVGCVGRRAR
ncbi:hypothetical protein C8J57DRAFT_1712847 [Mycena rebaudengoi]|nr:hypothetical protein C8J57DRAFT_1712847 [Mycena rebaudengoi]